MAASHAQPRNYIGSNNQPLRHNMGSGKYRCIGFTGNTQDNSSMTAGSKVRACSEVDNGGHAQCMSVCMHQWGVWSNSRVVTIKNGERGEGGESGERNPQRDGLSHL
jgi:hypothetical protein